MKIVPLLFFPVGAVFRARGRAALAKTAEIWAARRQMMFTFAPPQPVSQFPPFFLITLFCYVCLITLNSGFLSSAFFASSCKAWFLMVAVSRRFDKGSHRHRAISRASSFSSMTIILVPKPFRCLFLPFLFLSEFVIFGALFALLLAFFNFLASRPLVALLLFFSFFFLPLFKSVPALDLKAPSLKSIFSSWEGWSNISFLGPCLEAFLWGFAIPADFTSSCLFPSLLSVCLASPSGR